MKSGENGINKSESLSYLYDSSTFDGKDAYINVDDLLIVDEDGYYSYDSKENFAVFDADSNSFNIYDKPAVKNGDDIAGVNDGQFFPFNSASEIFGNNYQNQWNVTSTNEVLNHYFGVSVTTRFIQPENGMVNNSAMTYEFSGDDDVWIFIDDMLVADLGGIHSSATTKIDFSTGDVYVNDNKTTTIYEQFEEALYEKGLSGWEVDQYLEETFIEVGFFPWNRDHIFNTDTVHTVKFFYLERGHGASNMNLKFNLKTVPENSVVKIDELGNTLAGVDFALYKADENYKYSDKDLISLGTTDDAGNLVLIDLNNPDKIIDFNDLHDQGFDYFVLCEENFSNVYNGYRSIDEIHLRYDYYRDSDIGLVAVSNMYDTGAYSVPRQLISLDDTLHLYNGETVNLNRGGKVFAVIMYFDENAQCSAGGEYGCWYPLSGDAVNGYKKASTSLTIDSGVTEELIDIARENNYVANLSSSGDYEILVDALPGYIENYYFVDSQDAKFTVALYYTEANSLRNANSNNTFLVNTLGYTSSITREFATTVYIANPLNRLVVQKLDAEGNPMGNPEDLSSTSNARFALYRNSDVENGQLKPNAVPYDIVTVNQDTFGSEDLNLDNVAVFPSTSGKALTNGTYYLAEYYAPLNYSKNTNLVEIRVTDDGVFANAGQENDGIYVRNGVGHILRTVTQFSALGDIDNTLTNIVTTLETSTDLHNWETKENSSIHLKYLSTLGTNGKYYLEYGLDGDVTSDTPLTAGSDVGWTRLHVEQCQDHPSEPRVVLNDVNISKLFSGTTIVQISDQPEIGGSKTVNGKDTWGESFTIKLELLKKDGEESQDTSLNQEVIVGNVNTPGNKTEKYAFERISFTQSGEYLFKVSEQKGNNPYYSYDDSVYYFKAVVSDGSISQPGVFQVKFERTDAQGSPVNGSLNEFAFTNNYVELGTLDIQKDVDHLANLNPSSDTEFSIKVTFTLPQDFDEDEYNALEGENPETGQIDFKELIESNTLEVTFTLKDGQTQNIINIPMGATYKIEEINLPAGYELDANACENLEGTITASSNALVVNEYTVASAEGTIPIEKVIQNREWLSTDSFEIEISGNNATNTVSLSQDQQKADHVISFTEPGIYTYTVREKMPAATLPGMSYTAKTYTVIFEVEDNGNGSLTVSRTIVDDDNVTSEVCRFVNVYNSGNPIFVLMQGTKKYQDLSGGKPLADGMFTFKVEAEEGAPKPSGVNTNSWTVSNTGNNIDFGSITISNDDIADGKEVTYTYTITELSDENNAGMTYDTSIYTVEMKLQSDAQGQLSREVKFYKDGKVADGVVFSNTYDVKPEMVNISFKKSLTVPNNFDYENAELNPFTFTIEAYDTITKNAIANGDVSMPQNQSVQINVSELAEEVTKAFEGIEISKVGTYRFAIKEDIPEATVHGLTYDNSSIIVTIETEIGEGNELVSNISYAKDDISESEEPLTFENAYNVQAVSFKMDGQKSMTGLELNNGDFKFIVENPDQTRREVYNSSANGSDGNYTADIPSLIDWEFTAPGIYVFKISEDNSFYGGTYVKEVIDFDPSEYQVTVNVDIDYSTGKLKVDSYSVSKGGEAADAIVFENHYAPQPLTVNGNLKKELTGKTLEADEFSFDIRVHDETSDKSGVEIKGTTLTNDADGNIPYTLTFTKPGWYIFAVKENVEDSSSNGIIYDEEEKYIYYWIDINNENGNLEVSNSNASVTFNNSYQAYGTMDLAIYKEIDGRDWQDGDRFAFRIEGNDEATTNAIKNGKIVFMNGDEEVLLEDGIDYYDVTIDSTTVNHKFIQELKFKENGDHSYSFKVSELGNNESSDLHYDDEIKTVNVTQTDNGNGTLTVIADYQNHLTFTNEYLFLDEKSASVDLNATKILNKPESVDYVLADDAFSFKLEAMPSNPEYDPLTETKTITSGTAQDNQSTFTVFDDSIEFIRPGTYVYQLSEVNDGQAGISYDAGVYTISIEVALNDEGTALTAVSSITRDGQVADSATFVNVYNPEEISLNISGTKELYFGDAAKDFAAGDFNFVLEGIPQEISINSFEEALITDDNASEKIINETDEIEDNSTRQTVYPPMPQESADSSITVSTASSSEGIAAFTFGDITFTHEDVGREYTYKVSEVIPETANLNITYDERIYEVKVKVDAVDESGIEDVLKLDITYMCDGENSADIKFVNQYNPLPSTASISGTKLLTFDGNNIAVNENEFTFVLSDYDNGQTLQEVRNDAVGNFIFENITIDAEESRFVVSEKTGTDRNIQYSDVQYNVIVHAIDENGTWAVESIEYMVGDEAKDKIEFTNIFTPEPLIFQINAKKEMTGMDLMGNDFIFEIANEAGTVIDEASNDQEGNIVFELQATNLGSAIYQIKELNNGIANVIYDDAVYTVNVNISLEEREYKVEVTYSDGENTVTEMVFNNKYQEPEPTPTPTPSPDTDNHYIPVPNTAAK